MVKINGSEEDCAGIPLEEYLEKSHYDMKRIAVEINEEIVLKSQYGSRVLQDGDSVEVVSFVGGG